MQFSVGINKWGAISTVMHCSLNTSVLKTKLLYNNFTALTQHHLPLPCLSLACKSYPVHCQNIIVRAVTQIQHSSSFPKALIIISVYDKIHCTLFRLKYFPKLPKGLLIFFQSVLLLTEMELIFFLIGGVSWILDENNDNTLMFQLLPSSI